MKTDDTKGVYDAEQFKRQNAVLRKYAAIYKASEDKIGCQKIYVDIAGGIEEAFILDELIFFTLPRLETGKSGLRIWKEGVLWMAVSRTEWWNRKRLTPKQADGAIERLLKKELIFKEIFLFNKQPTTHLRLNAVEFLKRYGEVLEKENQPEDEADTIQKDINDLYEMMGVPVEDTPKGIPEKEEGIPFKEGVSPKGDFINSPDTTSTHPFIGANAPLDWKLGHGQEITAEDLDGEREKQMVDAANLLATTFGQYARRAFDIALAFMKARNVVIPEKKIKGQRAAVREMLEANITAQHIRAAVDKLIADGMTVVDLFSVQNTAFAIANPAPEQKATNPQGLEIGF